VVGRDWLTRLGDRTDSCCRMAAELLWTHAPKIDPTLSQVGDHGGGDGNLWGFNHGGANSGGGGFGSSWGFASDPAKPHDNPFTSSWGFSVATSLSNSWPEETLEEFKQRVRDEARQTERSVRAVLDDLNSEEFPPVEELIARAGVSRKRTTEAGNGRDEKRIKVDQQREPDEYELELRAERAGVVGRTADEEDEEEVERLARELMARSEAEAAREIDAEEGDEAGGNKAAEAEEDKSEEKLTLGRLMRVVGVEPGMFGWDDDLEDFVL